MLGDSLLVAPILNYDGLVDYYLPAGRWTNLLNGKEVEGARWVRETHDFLSLPLLARPNSVIPVGKRTDRPDYDYSDDLTLRVYQLESGKSIRVEIPSLLGQTETTFEFTREKDELHVRREGAPKAWKVLLVNLHQVASSARTKSTLEGTLVTPEETENSIEITLLA
jgi:alpha-D-xyloside xylohydrolase